MPRGKRKKYIDRDEYTKGESNEVPRNTVWMRRQLAAQLGSKSAADESLASGSQDQIRNQCGTVDSARDEATFSNDNVISVENFSDFSDESSTDKNNEPDVSEECTDDEAVETTPNETDEECTADDEAVETTPNETDESQEPRRSLMGSMIDLLTSDKKMHEHTETTLGEAFLLLLSFVLHHNLTYDALSDLLTLLQKLLPPKNLLPETKYHFLKMCNTHELANICEMKFYCAMCMQEVPDVTDETKSCLHCDSNFSKSKSIESGTFFLYFAMESQFRHLLQRDGIWQMISNHRNSIRHENGDIGDVSQGLIYRNTPMLQDNDLNISITWNCDGVPIFKSSRFCIWPLFCSVNELPPDERKKNVQLVALWFGQTKPKMNGNYLKPFVTEAKRLEDIGFSWQHPIDKQHYITKVACLFCVCDAPAKAAIQNMKLFNGKFGCPYCLHPGERTECGSGSSNVYLPKNPKPPSRTLDGVRRDATLAVMEKQVMHGIKGPSELLVLAPTFDIVNSFTIDYMHVACLGDTKMFVNALLNNSGQVYHLQSEKVKLLDIRIVGIHPPSEIRRILRTTKDVNFWKANEFRQFLFAAPILLIDLIPKSYYNHWVLLSSSIYTLLKDTISNAELAICEEMLETFVGQTEPLYGKQYNTFNVHMLSHIVQNIRYTGSMSSGSAFMFESLNGEIKNLVKGANGVHCQISRKFMLLQAIRHILEIYSHKSEDKSGCLSFVNHLVKGYPIVKSRKHFGVLTLFGTGILKELSLSYKILLNDYFPNSVPLLRVLHFKKVKIKNYVIQCRYDDNEVHCPRRDNNHVVLENKIYCEVRAIISLKDTLPVDASDILLISRIIKVVKNAKFGLHIEYATQFGDFLVISPTDIHRKCIFVDLPNVPAFEKYMFALIPLPNKYECD